MIRSSSSRRAHLGSTGTQPSASGFGYGAGQGNTPKTGLWSSATSKQLTPWPSVRGSVMPPRGGLRSVTGAFSSPNGTSTTPMGRKKGLFLLKERRCHGRVRFLSRLCHGATGTKVGPEEKRREKKRERQRSKHPRRQEPTVMLPGLLFACCWCGRRGACPSVGWGSVTLSRPLSGPERLWQPRGLGETLVPRATGWLNGCRFIRHPGSCGQHRQSTFHTRQRGSIRAGTTTSLPHGIVTTRLAPRVNHERGNRHWTH